MAVVFNVVKQISDMYDHALGYCLVPCMLMTIAPLVSDVPRSATWFEWVGIKNLPPFTKSKPPYPLTHIILFF